MILTKATTDKLKNKYFVPGVYFYGEMEERVGYDLVCTDDKSFIDKILEINETLTKPVEVLLDDNTKIDAMLFAWKGRRLNFVKGLIVDINDNESVEYAFSNLTLRPDSI